MATEFVGEVLSAIARVKEGEFQLMYMSPESLLTNHLELLRSDVYRENLVAFVVYEAHCSGRFQY